DCTTIPEGLMESELFGHERGAFTGAERQVQGECELSARGTLFLDEIGDLPSQLQGQLLRIPQDPEFERPGRGNTRRAGVGIVAPTNRDLAVMVARAQFRQDLYYRLKVVELELPRLRTRGASDIDLLAQYFLDLYARKHGRGTRTFSPAVLEELRRYTWPGNVRELEHTIERAVVVVGTAPQILPEHLGLPESVKAQSKPETMALMTLADVEKKHILRMLEAAGGNRTKAAQLLDIGRNTLQRKLKEYGIE